MFEQSRWYNKLPKETLDLYEPHLRLFFETMYERQMIWKRRFIDKKERPWTNNKIFQESKFTNVYRELDRNSQWQIKNILLDEGLTLRNLVWKLMVFRLFNNPATFTFEPEGKTLQLNLFKGSEVELISSSKWRNGIPDYDEYDEIEFSKFINGVRSCGQNPFTAAYLINSQAAPGKSRDYCYTRVVLPTLHKNINQLIAKVKSAKCPEDIIEYLKTLPSIADFIAHEIYQDFTYISIYTDRKFMRFDQNDFTNVGPGASLGIRLIYPNLKTVREQKQAIYWLRDCSEEWLEKIGKEKYGRTQENTFPYLHFNKDYYLIKEDKEKYDYLSYITTSNHNITLHQIEMWLCEFQKYWKMSIGEGKQRSKFVPKSKANKYD